MRERSNQEKKKVIKHVRRERVQGEGTIDHGEATINNIGKNYRLKDELEPIRRAT